MLYVPCVDQPDSINHFPYMKHQHVHSHGNMWVMGKLLGQFLCAS